jgi:hypothetical protein
MAATSDADDHIVRNRAAWNVAAGGYVDPGRRNWSSEPSWGIWSIPESDVHILPDVAGLDVIELGWGTGCVCAGRGRGGGRPGCIDGSGRRPAKTASGQPNCRRIRTGLIAWSKTSCDCEPEKRYASPPQPD